MALRAKRLESTELEQWARYCKWGTPNIQRRWLTAEDLDVSIGALNAAVLGMTAEVDIGVRFERLQSKTGPVDTNIVLGDHFSSPAHLCLAYEINLPGYDSELSKYYWTLNVYRPGDNEGNIIASGKSGKMDELTSPPPALLHPDYDWRTTAPLTTWNGKSKTLGIKGDISLNSTHNIHAIRLNVSYWPDCSDESGSAHLIVLHDKLG